jgi:glutathione S-transferase
LDWNEKFFKPVIQMAWEEQFQIVKKKSSDKETAPSRKFIPDVLRRLEVLFNANQNTIYLCGREPSIADFEIFATLNDLAIFGVNWQSYKRI